MTAAEPRKGRSISADLAMAPIYGYRADPKVPAFDDSKALIVYDGVCVLCSSFMRRIAARDTAGTIQFASAQSPLGQALFAHFGLDPAAFETVLLLDAGRAYGKLDMVTRLARRFGGGWRMLQGLKLLPRLLQDLAYDLVAKNRYRLFGRTETCMIPDASWRGRVIDHPGT